MYPVSDLVQVVVLVLVLVLVLTTTCVLDSGSEEEPQLLHVEMNQRMWFKNLSNMSVCLFVCLSTCLSFCLSACLPACLSVCLSTCLSFCLSVSLPVCPLGGYFLSDDGIPAAET